MSNPNPVEYLLAKVDNVKKTGERQWQARCPAHDDAHASLCVGQGDDGRALVKCQAGCSTADVLAAIGLEMSDLFPLTTTAPRRPPAMPRNPKLPQAPPDTFKASRKDKAQIVKTYAYPDAGGILLYEVARFDPKGFCQRRPDGEGHWVWGLSVGEYFQKNNGDWYKVNDNTPANAPRRNFPETLRVLYRLPELLAAMKANPDVWVFVVEGEKDVDNLWTLGLVATCNPGGAEKWKHLSDDSTLHGHRVAIIPDKDKPNPKRNGKIEGMEHAQDVARRLHGKAALVKLVHLPDMPPKDEDTPRKDVSDWIEWLTGADRAAALVKMAEDAQDWTPPATAETEPVETVSESSGAEAGLCSDIGNAARFAAAAKGRFLYCGQSGKWLHYDGRRWADDDALRVVRLAKTVVLDIFKEVRDAAAADEDTKAQRLAKWALASQKRDRLAAMIDLARCELSVSATELDASPWLLNVLNGTIDLRTGEMTPHRPEDRITKLAPVKFDPCADCPIWTAFLKRIMDGNAALISYLQRLAGVCLTADVSEQELYLFYGVGANGKSVFLDTLAGLLGDYAGEAAPDLLIERRNPEHPTEIADLCGRRFVVSCELPEGGRLRVDLLKRLTGNARLKGRYMRRDFFEFDRTHKLVVATNNKPVVRESTHAIWRRLLLIPFAVVIPKSEQDKTLLAKLQEERPGILNWAIAGCLAWQRDGMQTPKEVLLATQAYQDEQDPLADFLEERCIVAVNAFTPRAELYGAYKAWAEKQREYPLDRNGFYQRVRAKPGIHEPPARRVGGMPTRGFAGIGLLSPLLEGSHA